MLWVQVMGVTLVYVIFKYSIDDCSLSRLSLALDLICRFFSFILKANILLMTVHYLLQ
jgi:hypothetical protein